MEIADTMIPLAAFELMCDICREFNEYVPPERAKVAPHSPIEAKGDRPGAIFNAKASWEDILTRHGWTVDHASGERTYWTRPGKDRGVSATTGVCKSELGGDLFYVFSTNALPFEADTAYDKFGAYAQLEHNGDLSAAGKRLRNEGYGKPDTAAVFSEMPLSERVIPAVSGVRSFAINEDIKKLDLGSKWVWEGWLQAGTVNLLAAEAGMGKTRFVGDLCRRVHMCLPWPDGKPTDSCPWDSGYLAMWVAGDRNHKELLELSEAFGFGERICYSGSPADPLGGITLQYPSDFNALFQKVKEAKPLFVVIDTAGGATGFNLAKQEEARSFFAPLSDLALRLQVCVIVITHLNATKTTLGRRAEERVRSVIRLTAENREPDTTRRIEVVKSNSLFPKPLGMQLGPNGNEYTNDAPAAPETGFGGSAPERKNDDPSRGPDTSVRKCMDWLTAYLESTPIKVIRIRNDAQELGFSSKTLYQAKEALKLIEGSTEGYKWWGLRKE